MSSTSVGNLGPQQRKKLLTLDSNGTLPLPYPAEPPDDENMNEILSEDVELAVVLPDGNTKHVTVNANTPMLDLLIQLAATNKLSPAGHTIVVVSEATGKPQDYKPNQSIGSLCVLTSDSNIKRTTVLIKPKNSEKKSGSTAKSSQPFEMTYRFTINLPQNQKKVLRISPATPLYQIHTQICTEKRLDPGKHIFTLPGNALQGVDMQRTVGELGTNEINLTNPGMMMDNTRSMPDLSMASRGHTSKSDISTGYMPSEGKKKKGGFFSIFKKEKKFNVQSVHTDTDRGPPKSSSSGGSPPLRRKSDQTQINRPKTMYSTSLDNDVNVRPKSMMLTNSTTTPSSTDTAKPAPSSTLKTVKENVPPPRTKKRRAPAPPSSQNPPAKTIQVEISVEKQNIEKQTVTATNQEKVTALTPSDKVKHEQGATKFHSRNSSDSSGYHELTLSGAESPDAGRIDEMNSVKMNLETTSLDSGEHMNGDSGIRDISPPRRKHQQRATIMSMEVGASQTLPLHKQNKSDEVRSRSLERDEPKKKVVGKKKKAAPAPPSVKPPSSPEHSTTSISSAPAPQTQPSIMTSSMEVTDLPPPKPCVSKTHQDAATDEEDALAVAAVLDDLDRGLESPRMMMVENMSLASEDIDIDIDQQKHVRPCAFVPPPPPSEPYPEDSEPVDYNDVMGLRVDTVDVGVETSDDSCGPESTKSSPVSTHSRAESRTSISSVNTIEDLNMAFQLTIAVGEQAMLDSDSDHEEKSILKRESSRKKDEMISKSGTIELSSEGQTDSPRTDEKVSTESRPADNEVAEVSYDLSLNVAPTNFQSEKVDISQKQEEEDEEFLEITEVIYPFESSSGPNSPRRIPDFDTPKEHSFSTSPVKEKDVVMEIAARSEVTEVQEEPPQVIEEEKPLEKEPPKPKEKENFVFTLDDLDNIDYGYGYTSAPVVSTKPIREEDINIVAPPPPPPQPLFEDLSESKEVVMDNTLDVSFNEENDGFSNPVIDLSKLGEEEEEEVKDAEVKGSVKDRCSELSFSPSSEGEQEHVLEEKSISMIALPAMRAKKSGCDEQNSSTSKNLFSDNVELETEEVAVVDKTINNNHVHSDEDSGASPDPVVMQGQLQDQFAMWQEQLAQNQRLLSSAQSLPVDDSSTQLQDQLRQQLEMQKKMIEQMNRSMEALSLQQRQSPVTVVKSETVVQKEQVNVVESVPAPPPAPVLPTASQNGNVSTGVKPADKKVNAAVSGRPKGKGRRIIEPPKLDPREELMIAIRNKGGVSALRKVPVNKTKWHNVAI